MRSFLINIETHIQNMMVTWGQISADSIETSVWNEVIKVLRDPTLVIAELKRKQSKPARASLEAEKISFENRLKQLLAEEQRYLRLYGRGNLEESLLLVEMDRIQRERRSVEQRCKEIDGNIKLSERATDKMGEISQALTLPTERLENADYQTKQLALEALEVQAVAYPNGDIHINGTIPIGEQSYASSLP